MYLPRPRAPERHHHPIASEPFTLRLQANIGLASLVGGWLTRPTLRGDHWLMRPQTTIVYDMQELRMSNQTAMMQLTVNEVIRRFPATVRTPC